MTEAEAAAKQCRVGGLLPGVSSFANTGQMTLSAPTWPSCVGSACGHWRWAVVPNPDWKPSPQASTMWPDNPYTKVPAGIPSTTDGRCGLAAQP